MCVFFFVRGPCAYSYSRYENDLSYSRGKMSVLWAFYYHAISTYDESRLFCTSFFQIEITHRTFAFGVLRSDSFLALIMIRAGSKYVESERKKSAQLN